MSFRYEASTGFWILFWLMKEGDLDVRCCHEPLEHTRLHPRDI
jgi:hypothetical protein